MSNISKNSQAWGELFEKYSIMQAIREDGYFKISASQIKEFREPRLMAKFDHSKNLPKLFTDNSLAILPTSRGDYVISHFDAYHRLEADCSQIQKAPLPSYIQSLDCSNIPSEAIALNCAYASGIIADFMEDSNIVATVSGRMSSGQFSFSIGDIKSGIARQINVNGSQIEIDAAYEGVESLALLEAKMDLSDDFLVRQLYYPFRVWQSRVTKPVKPVFLIYSNGIFRLYEYKFVEPNDYNSMVLVKQKNYSIDDTTITSSDIQTVLEEVTIIGEPERIPFPQADKFERVINLCELVSSRELKKEDVTEEYDFDARQSDYYLAAARYLGLIERKREGRTSYYLISDEGRRVLSLGYKQRQLAFCSKILSHEAFNLTLHTYLRSGVMPTKHEIVENMKNAGVHIGGSENTPERRSSTIRGWVSWIVSLISE